MRILIVEDEPIIALEIETIVLDRFPEAMVSVVGSVGDALASIDADVRLAFLDIDVTDGKTYPLALELRTRRIPFVFVSGANRDDAPEGLAEERLVPKPFAPDDIAKHLDALKEEQNRTGNA